MTAVGPGKVYCALGEFWGHARPLDLTLDVACFMPGGSSVDSKFNVTFVTPGEAPGVRLRQRAADSQLFAGPALLNEPVG